MTIQWLDLPPTGKTPYGSQITIFAHLFKAQDNLEALETFIVDNLEFLAVCYGLSELNVLDNIDSKIPITPKMVSLLDQKWKEWIAYLNADNNTDWTTLDEMLNTVGVEYETLDY